MKESSIMKKDLSILLLNMEKIKAFRNLAVIKEPEKN